MNRLSRRTCSVAALVVSMVFTPLSADVDEPVQASAPKDLVGVWRYDPVATPRLGGLGDPFFLVFLVQSSLNITEQDSLASVACKYRLDEVDGPLLREAGSLVAELGTGAFALRLHFTAIDSNELVVDFRNAEQRPAKVAYYKVSIPSTDSAVCGLLTQVRAHCAP